MSSRSELAVQTASGMFDTSERYFFSLARKAYSVSLRWVMSCITATQFSHPALSPYDRKKRWGPLGAERRSSSRALVHLPDRGFAENSCPTALLWFSLESGNRARSQRSVCRRV